MDLLRAQLRSQSVRSQVKVCTDLYYIHMNAIGPWFLTGKKAVYIYKGLIMYTIEPVSEHQYCVVCLVRTHRKALPPLKLMWSFSWVLASKIWLTFKWSVPDNLQKLSRGMLCLSFLQFIDFHDIEMGNKNAMVTLWVGGSCEVQSHFPDVTYLLLHWTHSNRIEKSALFIKSSIGTGILELSKLKLL